MQYNQYFFLAFYFLTAVTTSYGMKDRVPSYLNSFEEITIVKNPRCVRYITNDSVAISSPRECSLVDLETKAMLCINQKNNDTWSYVSFPLLQTNNKRVISFIGEKVVIYDMQTGAKKWFIPKEGEILALAVHPCNDTVFLSYAQTKLITKYNYLTDARKDVIIPGQSSLHMVIHPKKEIMCRVNFSAGIFLHSLGNLSEARKTITLPGVTSCEFLQYSLDGSHIVSGNHEKLYVIDPDNKSDQNTSIKHLKNERFNAIAFHSKDLLATLATRKTSKKDREVIIHYWDLQTKQLVHTSSALGVGRGYDLSFSPDGLEAIVALEDKCVRTLVSFAVNEKGTDLLWWLNQIKEQKSLPQDVVTHCMHTFLRSLSF